MMLGGEVGVEKVVLAAQTGEYSTVKAFLEAGGDVETRDASVGMVRFRTLSIFLSPPLAVDSHQHTCNGLCYVFEVLPLPERCTIFALC